MSFARSGMNKINSMPLSSIFQGCSYRSFSILSFVSEKNNIRAMSLCCWTTLGWERESKQKKPWRNIYFIIQWKMTFTKHTKREVENNNIECEGESLTEKKERARRMKKCLQSWEFMTRRHSVTIKERENIHIYFSISKAAFGPFRLISQSYSHFLENFEF